MKTTVKSAAKPTVRIENWELLSIPGTKETILVGNVAGHPLFTEGKLIRTSSIVVFDSKQNYCETLNTIYILGKPWWKVPA